jgi:hypothetical protein
LLSFILRIDYYVPQVLFGPELEYVEVFKGAESVRYSEYT